MTLIASGSDVPWRLQIYAQGGTDGERSGYSYVGAVRLLPWQGSADRVVAFAHVPGAQSWAIDGRPEQRTRRDELRLDLLSAEGSGPFGVHSVRGASLDGSRSMRITSGVSGGPVNILGQVYGWSAVAGAVDATVLIYMPGMVFPGQVVTIPAGTSFGDELAQGSSDFVEFTFTNTLSYVIDWEAPGMGVDDV